MTSLMAQLNQLSRAELIRVDASQPELAYIFRHALVQDAAYQSMLHSERRRVHQRVAHAYEQLYADRLGEFAALLAHHFAAAGDDVKTVEYAIRAGEAAARLFAFAEARSHYALALRAIANFADGVDKQRQFVSAVIKLTEVSWGSESPARNLARLREAEACAMALDADGDRLLLAHIYYWMARLHFYGNEYTDAIRNFQKVVELAAHSPATQPVFEDATSLLGAILTFQGQFSRATALLADALTRSSASANWPAWIRITAFSGIALAARGDYLEGLARGEQASARAVELNQRALIPISYIWLAQIHLLGGNVQQILVAATAALNAADEIEDHLVAHDANMMLAWGESRLGNHERASEYLTHAQAISRRLGGRIGVNQWLLAGEAEIALSAGQPQEAWAKADAAIAYAEGTHSLFTEGVARRIKACALAELDPAHADAALAEFDQSVRVLEQGDARLEMARTHQAWGAFLRARGDMQAAREHLERAAAQFEASGLSVPLEQTRSMIACLN